MRTRNLRRLLTTFSALVVGASAGLAADLQEAAMFHGICDISAAAPLDDHTVIVASDEENRLFSFALKGGNPIAVRGLEPLLNMPPDSDEIDFEAAAIGGGRIWWLGSHQAFKPQRNTIFATNVPGPDLRDLAIVVPPFDLAALLRAAPEAAGVWHPATWLEKPKKGGFNIEAAAIARNGDLLIGLRAPLDGPEGRRGAALVLAIALGDAPRVSMVHRIDLGNRGVRGMAASLHGFYLIAGPVDDGAASEMFHWRPGEAPEQVEVPGLDQINPEAVVTTHRGMLVFSDDGNRRMVGDRRKIEACKDLQKDGSPKARTRALRLRLR